MLARTRFPRMPMDELRREMDRLLNNYGAGWAGPRPFGTGIYPALNVWDGGDALVAESEVPGVREEDLEVFANGNELTIKGCRNAPEGEKLAFHRRERGAGEFTRVVTLPVEIDAENVEASLKDGVLTLRLPKAESAKPRKIAVRAG